jgi:hypothetical protein
VTSALLFVALLVLVDVSYRRWIRHSVARRRQLFLDLTDADATSVAMPPRDEPRAEERARN